MISTQPSPRFYALRRSTVDWQRWRTGRGLNFAQAAQEHGLTLREWAMLECNVTPENLVQGRYPSCRNRGLTRPS